MDQDTLQTLLAAQRALDAADADRAKLMACRDAAIVAALAGGTWAELADATGYSPRTIAAAVRRVRGTE